MATGAFARRLGPSDGSGVEPEVPREKTEEEKRAKLARKEVRRREKWERALQRQQREEERQREEAGKNRDEGKGPRKEDRAAQEKAIREPPQEKKKEPTPAEDATKKPAEEATREATEEEKEKPGQVMEELAVAGISELPMEESAEAQESKAAEDELQSYLEEGSRGRTSTPLRDTLVEQLAEGPKTLVLRLTTPTPARAEPEGLEQPRVHPERWTTRNAFPVPAELRTIPIGFQFNDEELAWDRGEEEASHQTPVVPTSPETWDTPVQQGPPARKVWWYEDEEEEPPVPATRVVGPAEVRTEELEPSRSRSRRRSRSRASKYNPRRHLTMEDYESVQPQPRQASPGPPPPTSRSTSRSRKEAEIIARKPTYFIKLTGVMFGQLTPIATNPNLDPPPRVCFNCWQPDHRSTQCPRPKKGVYCKNCGRRGVDLSDCPRCKEQHRRYLAGRYGNEGLAGREPSHGFPPVTRASPPNREAGAEAWGPRRRESPPPGYETATRGRPHVSRREEMDQQRGERETRAEVPTPTPTPAPPPLRRPRTQLEQQNTLAPPTTEAAPEVVPNPPARTTETEGDLIGRTQQLLDSIRNLPIETQNEIVRQVFEERREARERARRG